jgi:hypothetical protein
MSRNNKPAKTFKELLEKYLQIKGLDIIVVLGDGEEIQLYKNRELINDIIITNEKGFNERRIPLTDVTAVDLYAA